MKIWGGEVGLSVDVMRLSGRLKPIHGLHLTCTYITRTLRQALQYMTALLEPLEESHCMLSENVSSVGQVRTARLEARITPDQKQRLQRAATLSGRSLSDFIVASAQEAASRVLQENQGIRLSQAEQLAFVNALLAPPEPGVRLRQAAAAYRQQVGI